jgi:hypothetical protein
LNTLDKSGWHNVVGLNECFLGIKTDTKMTALNPLRVTESSPLLPTPFESSESPVFLCHILREN